MSTFVTLPAEKAKSTPFVDKGGNAAFYRLLAETRGMDWDDIGKDAVDPTRIYVSRAMFENWLDGAGSDEEREFLSMLIVNYGPKVDETLDVYTVRIDD